ncbi:MAG: M14 family zinc carboxypeptidase [Lewinella sp.]|nr:M14 family zinc carboxypeptidase [Lewinella sp.]
MRLTLLLFVLAFSFLSLTAQTEGFHRAKIYYSDAAQMLRLMEMGVDLDHGRDKNGYSYESDFSAAELSRIREVGLNYEIIIKDVDKFYVDQNNPASPRYVGSEAAKNTDCGEATAGPEIISPENYNGGSMGGFLTYSEMLAELDEMYTYCQANNIDIITQRADNTDPADPNNFKTEEGNYQQWVKISDNPTETDDSEPEILYDALHHAREPASMQQLVFFMWYLIENYTTSEEVRSIVDNTELYFIPCVNPDGYLYNEQTNPNGGGFWRKNRRGGYGVDLNRNYNYVEPNGNPIWNTSGVSQQESGETYPGTSAFSEPETRAIRYFVESHNFTIALNNHTSGGLLLYPFGYARERYTPDNGYYEQLSEAMVRANGYDNILSSSLYPASGDSDDFMYGFLETVDGGTREKVLAMTPEIGPAFWPAQSQIEGISKDMLVHNMTAAQALNRFAILEETTTSLVSSLTFSLTYNLTRIGFADGDFTVSIEPVSANIASVGPNNTHTPTRGELLAGELEVTINEVTEAGDEVVFDLVLDNGNFTTRQRIIKVYGQTESIFTNEAEDIAAWTTNGWGLTTSEFYPGSPSASLTDSPNGEYDDRADNTLTLNETIDLTQANVVSAMLSFYAKWAIESDYDQVQLEVSIDGGTNWIPQCGTRTRPGTQNHLTPGEPVYDGNQEEWVLEEASLSDYIGEMVMIRFELRSDGGVTDDGFYVDALSADIVRRLPVGTDEPLTAPVSVGPNPVNDVLEVKTDLSDYSATLTNALGQVVDRSTALSGFTRINTGSLPAGAYQLTIVSDGKQRSFKIVK